VGTCELGVKTVSGLLQISFQEAIVSLKDLQGLMAGNLHNGQMVNASPTHVGNCRVPEI